MISFASAVLASGVLLAAERPSDGPDQQSVDAHLSQMHLTLTETKPYRFVLAYQGPTMPFRGDVCYHFAGYNETCLDPKLDWLTPATEILLYAPGGVPRDLLEGYMMLVRFPALSPRTFRLAPPRER